MNEKKAENYTNGIQLTVNVDSGNPQRSYKTTALEGILVVDFTRVLAGPTCTRHVSRRGGVV